jgi:WD40 repeat protein
MTRSSLIHGSKVCFTFLACASLAWSTAALSASAAIPISKLERSTPVDFAKEILPILRNNCLACHNQTRAKAELVLETPQTILKGSENGPVLVPGRSEASLLLQVASHQAKPTMPPSDNKVAAADLTSQELGLIKLWIDQGSRGEVERAVPVEWQPLPDSFKPIYAVALTPDGQIAACNRANQIYVYHLPSKRLLTCLTDPQLSNQYSGLKNGLAHHDSVQALAFTPDGNVLASGGYREVKLWRRRGSTQTFQVPPGTNEPTAIAVSSDGNWLATGDHDGRINLVQLPIGKTIKTLRAGPQAVECLQFSPHSSRLLSASEDHVIRIWDLADGSRFAEAGTNSAATALAWLDDGQQFASGTCDGLIHVWAAPCQVSQPITPVAALQACEGQILSLHAIPHRPEELLSGGMDGLVRHWNITSGKLIREMKHGGPVVALAVRSNAGRYVSVGLDNTAALWAAESGKEIARLKGDRYTQEQVADRERALRFATNEVAYCQAAFDYAEKERKAQTDRVRKATDALAAAEKSLAEKRKKLDEAAEAKAVAQKAITELTSEVAKAKASYDVAEAAAEQARLELPAASRKQAEDKLAAARKQAQEAEAEVKKAAQAQANADNELTLAIASAAKAAERANDAQNVIPVAEAEVKRVQAELDAARRAAAQSETPIRVAVFSTDNVILATGGDDRLVHTWSADTGYAFETLHSHKTAVVALAFQTPEQFVSVSSEGAVIGWDLSPAWTLESVLGTGDAASPLSDRVNALAFSPDGRTLATGSGEPSRNGQIQLWNVATGRLTQEFNDVHSDAVFGLAFSRNGQYLASSAADRFMRILDLSTGKVTRSFEGHTHHVLGVAWKQDGRTLATAGADDVVKIWDFRGGERRKNIGGFEKEVTSISCFADGQFLAASGDHQVCVVNENGETVHGFKGAKDFLYSAAATPDGKWIIAGGQDGILWVWDGVTGKLTGQLH